MSFLHPSHSFVWAAAAWLNLWACWRFIQPAFQVLLLYFQTLSVGLIAEGCESNPVDGGEIPSCEPGYNSLAIFPCGKIKQNCEHTANQLAMTSSAMCLCSYCALSQTSLLLPTPTWSKINITEAAIGSRHYSAPFGQQSLVSVASFLFFPQCRS